VLKNTDYRSGNRLDWLSRGIKYFKNQDEDLGHIYKAINSFVLFLNPPDHMPIRTMVIKTWDDREVHQQISDTADELLKKLSRPFDLMKDYAQQLPAIVISRIMGIPMEDYMHLRTLGVEMIRSLDLYHTWRQLVELNQTSRKFVEYFAKLVVAKRNRPGDGMIGRLIVANEKEKLLTDEQLISVLIFLFIAGEETTASSIGTGLHNIIRDPLAYGQLRKNPELLKSTATDELFRFDPPVQLLGRITKADCFIGGVSIPAESALTLVLGSANRDDTQFENAATLNLCRSPNQHLAFGYGTHFCLGEWLGKLQTQIAIERFVMKYENIHIPEQDLEWNRNLSVRGMKSLIVNARS
jgi:pimeloyl-[acyl-carrier protein] synthase